MNKIKSIIALALILGAPSGLLAQDTAQDSVKVGDPAPTFFLPVLDGSRFFLSEHIAPKGNKTVILDFYTTWCKPCQKELPLLDSLVKRYPADSLIFVLVDVGEKKDTVLKYFDTARYNCTVLLDQFNAVGEKYGVKSFPTLVIIDKQGIVRFIGNGFDQKKGVSELGKALDKIIYKKKNKRARR
jgi:thiol-disulfide isomerase/thioredoxin